MQNLRQKYLFDTLGLSHDPFATPTAEQEFGVTGGNEPRFFSYFVNPQSEKSEKPIWKILRQYRNGFVFGPPGSGKTSLRYTLEADYHTENDRTLVVTYEFSDRIDSPPTADTHWRRLAEELAIDFFIQVVERLNEMDTFPTNDQYHVLQNQMALIWRRKNLQRIVDIIINDSHQLSNEENGVASLWRRLNRQSSIRYITPSDKIRTILQTCIPTQQIDPQNRQGETLLTEGIKAVKLWGFERISVLVDGVDAYERKPKRMVALIGPLLKDLPFWQTQHLFFYFFLTTELQPLIPEYTNQKMTTHLTFPPIRYIIEWNNTTLAKLLHQRFQSANSRFAGFNAIADPEWNGELENSLIDAAKGSPRQLLETVSALIDAHASRASEQLYITRADWDAMQQTTRSSIGLTIQPDQIYEACYP